MKCNASQTRNDFIKRVQQDGKNESINFQPIKFQSETCNNNIGSKTLQSAPVLHYYFRVPKE